MSKKRPEPDVQPLPNEELVKPVGEQGQHGDTADDKSDRPLEPRKDHAERRGGGDQDIDTAGMVPGNKATTKSDGSGF